MTRADQYRAALRDLKEWDALLMSESRLPGPRANLELVQAAADTVAYGDRDNRELNTTLNGFHENEAAVFTDGHGTLRLKLSDTAIDDELRYADLTGNPLVAHIHLGEWHVNGGVIAFLCGGRSKPPCPSATSGTVSTAGIGLRAQVWGRR